MQTLEGLQKRINTAHDLLAVVKTMKSLAAVNIRQFETAAQALESFTLVIDQGWQVLFRNGAGLPPAAKDRDRTMVFLVFGSAQGMCGQYNESIVDFAITEANRLAAPNQHRFWAVGDKASASLADRATVALDFNPPGGLAGINERVQEIVNEVEEWQRQQKAATFHILHHQLGRGASVQPVRTQLLPLDRVWLEEQRHQPWPGRCLPQKGTAPALLFSHLFRHYLFATLFRAFAQALASENAARLTAMQAAEKNILEKEEELQATFRDTRQSEITAELLDIISGFEAMGGEREGGESPASSQA